MFRYEFKATKVTNEKLNNNNNNKVNNNKNIHVWFVNYIVPKIWAIADIGFAQIRKKIVTVAKKCKRHNENLGRNIIQTHTKTKQKSNTCNEI